MPEPDADVDCKDSSKSLAYILTYNYVQFRELDIAHTAVACTTITRILWSFET